MSCNTIIFSRRESCKQPSEAGTCYNYTIRYFFDQQSQACTAFYYGGCEGNDNNFVSQEDCEAVCTDKIPEKGHDGEHGSDGQESHEGYETHGGYETHEGYETHGGYDNQGNYGVHGRYDGHYGDKKLFSVL